jgi:hypothetical protein
MTPSNVPYRTDRAGNQTQNQNVFSLLRHIVMDSYGIAALFRSPRHDAFNRKLADDLARPNHKIVSIDMNGHIDDKSNELAGIWMYQSLARVKPHRA